MAPPKPPNPSSKEILEEALQITTLNLNNAMQETQEQMDVRFHQISTELSNLQTRFDNDKSVEDSRFDSIMAAINKISIAKELQQAITTTSATVHGAGSTSRSATVHGSGTTAGSATVHGTVPPVTPVTVHGTAVTSGMIQNPHSISRVPPPNFHNLSPTHTPLRNSATFSTTHPQPTPNRYIHPHTSSTFVPYPPIPTILSTSQPFTIPFSQQPPFSQFPSQHPYPNLSNIPPLPTARSPKLELPMFDGSGPLDWLFQAEQFFNFYNMPPENRLSLISFYMKGDALSWFKWMHNSHLLSDWASFTRALELRFGPSTYDNHQAELFKLKQEGTVVEYQTKFEQLGNQVVGLPQDAILNCFISGLNADIRNEMAIQKPTNISQAIGLAKLIEAKLKDSKPKFPKPYANSYPKPNPTPSAAPTQKNQYTTPAQSTFRPKTPSTQQPSHLPIKKLSQAQIQERRAQGLCFNCDEKFIPGHRCATGRFLILLCDDEVMEHTQLFEEQQEAVTETEPSDTYFQLSTQALTGQFSPQTLKFKGLIGGLSVMVLVDTGSTHNILQPRIAHHLNLLTTPIPQFSVMVGNGSHLQCEGICNDVKLTLQEKQFSLPFYLLPIEGADVVLGMAWLRTLGPIQADFSVPSITFNHENYPMTIQGDSFSSPQQTTFHQLKQLVHQNSIASLHLMLFQPSSTSLATPHPNPLENLPTNTHPQLSNLLYKFSKIFQSHVGLPPSRTHDHHITLIPNTTPINVKPYRYPHSQKTAMTTIIDDMLKEGLIKPSHSPFSSPVLLVKKKDGTWRFCVDYRALNAVTVKDRFPIPTIDELLDELGSAKVFTKLDLRSGYHQIRMASEDTHKTAFRTFDGHYEFLVMPFGLTNAPSTFQSAMNDLLRPYLRKFVLVFFDDILIYSTNFSDHLAHLQIIFQLLMTNFYVVKLSKCVFAVSTVHYLGHVISMGTVAPDAEKIKAILDWPQPRSLTALRGFLGLTGFYRRFVKKYASLAAPLTDLLRSTKFVWSTEAAAAFTELQRRMTDMPVLSLPDFTKKFIVETDASGVAIGAVLSQDGHPIAYFSKKLCPRMQAASVYVREMFAVTEAIKKWRQYLIGQEFHIYTDQKSLRNLLLQKIQTPEQQKWASKLQGFNFEIFYKPGKSNLVADALSRKYSVDTPTLLAISSPIPDIISSLRKFYAKDERGKQTVKTLLSNTTHPDFKFSNGLLFYKDKIFVPETEQIRTHLLWEFHSTPSAGHSGLKATLARISTSFSWPGIYKEAKSLIKTCKVCQQNKYLTQKKKGLLQPLPTPKQAWEDISMDFITKLPNSFGHTTIWVVCDRLTKSAHFIAMPSHFSAQDLARRFTMEITRLHGQPKSIVSDRDPLFLSTFWKTFFKEQGTILKYSTAYHPETDGQTEVINRSIGTYLRCFVSSQPSKWYKFLHHAEYWYNTSFHSSIGMTPFRALYGRDPPSISDYVNGSTSETLVEDILQQKQQIFKTLNENLQKSRIQMEKQANTKRSDVTFQVGDRVLLKLQPYRQQTVQKRPSQKLASRFCGPFTVIKRVGQVAYLLDLPSSSRVHPVFHVSLLRPYFGTDPLNDFKPLPPSNTLPFLTDLDSSFLPNDENLQNRQQTLASQPLTNSASNKPRDLLPSGHHLHTSETAIATEEDSLLVVGKKTVREDEKAETASMYSKKEERNILEKKNSLEETEREKDNKRIVIRKSLTSTDLLQPFQVPKGPTCSALSKKHMARGDLSRDSALLPNVQKPAHVQLYPTRDSTLFPNVQKPSHIQLYPNSISAAAACTNTCPTKTHTNPNSSKDLPDPPSQRPNKTIVHLDSSSVNLEDKVLNKPMSIDKKLGRPNREKKISVLLKDFYY
ncbi:uncharacterized protein LOC131659692 [Vicia villosa]|uniref:uncharacterized protein LOC131659692 n=1 Tax=Vicia villosa TaxID=3911 RepID=UPI00273BBDA5|nr:uncharacterized protein LOC131659692 [Vicia villosa]